MKKVLALVLVMLMILTSTALAADKLGFLPPAMTSPFYASCIEGATPVAEALGYYFDARGGALLASSSVGIELEGLRPSCRMAAVAAGARKAQAIASVMRSRPRALLVTDEGAAREMLRLASST